MDLNCPYCDKELEVCHDDGFGYEEGVKHQMECSGCGETRKPTSDEFQNILTEKI